MFAFMSYLVLDFLKSKMKIQISSITLMLPVKKYLFYLRSPISYQVTTYPRYSKINRQVITLKHSEVFGEAFYFLEQFH